MCGLLWIRSFFPFAILLLITSCDFGMNEWMNAGKNELKDWINQKKEIVEWINQSINQPKEQNCGMNGWMDERLRNKEGMNGWMEQKNDIVGILENSINCVTRDLGPFCLRPWFWPHFFKVSTQWMKSKGMNKMSMKEKRREEMVGPHPMGTTANLVLWS